MRFANKDYNPDQIDYDMVCDACGRSWGEHWGNRCPPNLEVGSGPKPPRQAATTSDGSTASYYELPEGVTELQHLISHRDMNAQIGEIFRACYRYGQASHSGRLRDAKKIKFYAEAEIARLEKLEKSNG